MNRERDGERDRVFERRLDAGLREVLGGERAPDVLDAVLARAAAGDVGERPPAAASARGGWLALAAVFLLGVLTVVGVAVLQRGDDAVAPAEDGPPVPQDAAAIVEVDQLAAIAALPRTTKGVQLRNLDDAAVEELAHRCPELETLQLWCSTAARRAGDGAAVSVTERAFAAIATLARLRRLELYGTVDVTGAGLRELERLPLLEALRLQSFDVADEHLATLANWPSLRELSLAFNHVLGPDGIAAIGRCVGLRRLSLRATPGQPRGSYAPLAALRELEELDLGGINVMTRTFADEATGRRLGWRNGGEPLRGGGVRKDVLQDWPRLTTLSLHSAFELEADVGKLLHERYPRLRSLDLSGCRAIDDTTIVYVVGIPGLRQLRLDDCPGIGEPSIGLLAANVRLREVRLGAAAWPTLANVEALLRTGKNVVWTPPADRAAGFAALQAKYAAALAAPRSEQVRTVAELEALPGDVTRIECRELGDRAAALLGKRTNLVAVELIGDAPDDRLTAKGLAAICALPKLESLELLNLGELSGADLRALGGLRSLRSLRCVDLALDDAALEALAAGAPALERLSLVACPSFGGRGMAAIGHCGALKRLELPKATQLDADALAHAGALRQLEELDLSGNPGLHDRAMMPLQHCTALRRLNVADAPFTSKALQALAGLRGVEALDLSGNAELVSSALLHVPVTVRELALDRCGALDANAAALLRDRFPSLRELRLADNEWVTDDVLRTLASMPSLQRLSVARCRALTNASFATIRGAKQLRLADCNGTACVTKEQHEQLRVERPELEVVRFVW
jgi:hypothetical protein